MKNCTVCCIDSINDGVAKIIVSGDTSDKDFVIQAELLPEGAKEGSWLNITLDEDAEKRAKDEIASLYDSLGNEP